LPVLTICGHYLLRRGLCTVNSRSIFVPSPVWGHLKHTENTMAENFKDKAEDAGHNVAKKVNEAGRKAGDKAQEAAEWVKDKAKQAGNKIEETGEAAKKKIHEATK
jgi:hypothetical protein